jgi:DNA-binding transcriptional ArsR family regulator
MVEQTLVSPVFHALAHDARRAMIAQLAQGEQTVTELAAPLDMSLAAASKHIQVLERAGIVRRTIAGRRHICRLDAAPLADVTAWLRTYERFWNERLDALQSLFPDPQENAE